MFGGFPAGGTNTACSTNYFSNAFSAGISTEAAVEADPCGKR